jgi:hypothetical protein
MKPENVLVGRASHHKATNRKDTLSNTVNEFAVHSKKWIKGQCHEIFHFTFFFMNKFLQAAVYPIRRVSNVSKNSQRYLQLKLHHRCVDNSGKWKKSSLRNVLIFLFEHLWVVELTYR